MLDDNIIIIIILNHILDVKTYRKLSMYVNVILK